jgi:cytochrome o ubiquinol oxidase subunit II
MSTKQKLGVALVLAVGLIAAMVWRLRNNDIAVLQPRGTIGTQEKHLIILAVLLSMIVVIPVYVMLFGFAWRYREGNKKAKYQPDLSGSRLFESIWWGVPLILITILGVVTYRSSQQLDPFKSLSSVPPMRVQVVALQWKWLFIYPEQNIASVNFAQIPVNTPIKFEITSDAPMNSFWIPQLGGQIYAMSGMATNLNLEANQTGDYRGVSANISGEGFAAMHFMTRASSKASFDQWADKMHAAPKVLTAAAYQQLAEPSTNSNVVNYGGVEANLFDSIINKYEPPIYFNPGSRR